MVIDHEMPTNQAPKRILLVDDESAICNFLKLQLQSHDYVVQTASGGAEALELVTQEGLPDLAIIDILMPGMNGFELAAQLQKMGSFPIFFLSALSATNTKVEGITRYAEDYVVKPVIFNELLARIRRVLLSSTTSHPVYANEVFIDSDLRINIAQKLAVVRNVQVKMTPTETRLISILCNNRGRVVSSEQLLSELWKTDNMDRLEALYVHVVRLRNKIEEVPKKPKYITSVWGVGYMLP